MVEITDAVLMTKGLTITVTTRTVERVCDVMPLNGKITKTRQTLKKSPVATRTTTIDTPRIKQAKKTNSIVMAPAKSPERLRKPKQVASIAAEKKLKKIPKKTKPTKTKK